VVATPHRRGVARPSDSGHHPGKAERHTPESDPMNAATDLQIDREARVAWWVATILWALIGVLLVGHVVLGTATGTLIENGPSDLVLVVGGAVTSLLVGGAGWLIVTRQRGNTIGWLLIAIPLFFALAAFNGDYATYTLVAHPGSLPLGRLSAWFDRWSIVAVLAIFIPVFLLFPDGHIPSRRWRPVLWLAIGAPAMTLVAFAVTPGRLTGSFAALESVRVVNPLGIEALADLATTVNQVGGALTLVAAALAAGAIVVRFRGARGEVRQQIKWLALVAVLFFVVFILNIVLQGILGESDLGNSVGNLMFVVMFFILALGIPAACAVAILKYRLYDLDVVVRKTVVFGSLAVFITVVYAAIVGGVNALIGSRSNALASFAAAAVLAVAFAPARDRARRLADRLVYGARATPYEVLTEFSSRMATTYSDTDVLDRMAEIVGSAVGATEARVWLRLGSEVRQEASWPDGSDSPSALPVIGDYLPEFPDQSAFEVRHNGELLGALTVQLPPSDPMNPAKEKLVSDLAAQAGLVLRNVRLIQELRASRQRLVSAQDEERRRLERDIHDGAQQQLVALSVKLGLAESLVERDPAKARELLDAMRSESSEALDNLRDLARGIYPPLLAAEGLASALAAQARKSLLPVVVEAAGVGRYHQDIEATVYFCTLEAMQNVAKYAHATGVTVRLITSDGHLTFEVSDDGDGFDPSATKHGTGLQGMADRLDAIGGILVVTSAPTAGTTITGTLPTAPPSSRSRQPGSA
jgi:signal transduction histidine kinase